MNLYIIHIYNKYIYIKYIYMPDLKGVAKKDKVV